MALPDWVEVKLPRRGRERLALVRVKTTSTTSAANPALLISDNPKWIEGILENLEIAMFQLEATDDVLLSQEVLVWWAEFFLTRSWHDLAVAFIPEVDPVARATTAVRRYIEALKVDAFVLTDERMPQEARGTVLIVDGNEAKHNVMMACLAALSHDEAKAVLRQNRNLDYSGNWIRATSLRAIRRWRHQQQFDECLVALVAERSDAT